MRKQRRYHIADGTFGLCVMRPDGNVLVVAESMASARRCVRLGNAYEKLKRGKNDKNPNT